MILIPTSIEEYENTVIVFSEMNDVVHIVSIEASIKGKGYGDVALKSFISKHSNNDITLDATQDRVNWYLRNGFEIVRNLDDEFVKMIRKAG